MTRSFGTILRWGCAALVMTLPAALVAQESSYCVGFEGGKRVTRFGSNAVSSERAESMDDFRRLMGEHRAELEGIMREKGLGDLIDELFDAVQSGEGVSQRKLARGEKLDWMSSRKEGTATADGPVCLDLSSSEDTWEVKIRQESVQPAVANCQLRVSSDCSAGTITVDASGSSAGVEVSMAGSGRSTSILSGSSQTWTGSFDERFGTDYSFTATASGGGGRTTTIHTFVIPKTCLNLSYSGEPEVITERLADSCTETARIERCSSSPAACTIELSDSRARSKGSVDLNVSGHWDPDNDESILVTGSDQNGQTVARLSSFPASVSFPRPGTYTFDGTAINEAGESRTCTAKIEVDPRFTVRAMGLVGYPADDVGILAPGNTLTPEEGATISQIKTHSGVGVGGDFEYHFNPRIGLNTSLQYIQFDNVGMFDSCCVWEMEDGDMDYLSLTIGPNFHLTKPGSRADFYLGPFIGYADLEDATFVLPSARMNFSHGGEFVWGGLAGLDLDIGNRGGWFLHFGARYVDLEYEYGAELDDGTEFELDFSPTIIEFGVANKF